MSASELAQLEALLVKVLPDPMGFAERVAGELAERLAAPSTSAAAPTVVNGYDVAAHEALAAHNLLLAGALGACECWGHRPDCPTCSGRGGAGWTRPDPHLFDEYVAPAARRLHARHVTPDATDAAPSAARPADEVPAHQATVGGAQ